MVSRRSPSQREKGTRVDRVVRAMVPGTHLGRVVAASPSRAVKYTIPNAYTEDSATTPPSSSLFQRNRFTLTSTTPSLVLTHNPQVGSVHVYLNGIEQDEATDYTVTGIAVDIQTAMQAVSGDVIDVRYAYLLPVPNASAPFVDAATSVGTLSPTFAATMPTLVTIGNLLVAGVQSDRGDTISTPTGWTLRGKAHNGYCMVYIFTRLCNGTEGSTLTFTSSTTAGCQVVIASYAGSTVIAASSGIGGDSVHNFDQPTVALSTQPATVIHASAAQTGVVGTRWTDLGPDVTIRGHANQGTTDFAMGDFQMTAVGVSTLESASDNADAYAGVTIGIA